MSSSPLQPQHQALIAASAISREVARARGYRSVASKKELADLGFSKAQQLVPTLVIPIRDVNGKIAFHQHRPDRPRTRSEKPVKYETRFGASQVLDVPPAARADMGDPQKPLWITEGARKADAAVSHGLCCISLNGVWGWRGTNKDGGKTALADWESIALNGRRVFLCFDSDVVTKKEVALALSRLTAFLERKGAKVTVVYLPCGEGGVKVGLDDFLATHTTEELIALSAATTATTEQAKSATPADNPKKSLAGDGKPRPPSQSKVLIEFIKSAEVFCSPDGETAYATVTVKGHRETWAVKSTGFRRYLARRFYEQEQKAPSSQAVQEALGVIESNAYYGGAERHHVHTRLGELGGAIYLDLANDAWEAVKITAAGWQVVPQVPVRFRHPKALMPLPTPVAGGTLEELRTFINVKDEADWKLALGWLIGAVSQVGPYPVLVVGGEHGSGKSTAGSVLRRVIDPNASLLRAEPRNTENLIISANNGWVVNLDNMSGMQPWLSDSICRISTGGGLSKRELYSDDGETILSVKRPVILNGIEEIVTRPDLLDRSLLLSLPTIPEGKRMPEREFWPLFDAAHPKLLGAVLDAVVVALKRVSQVHLDRLPRMADFAIWVTAAEPALGWKDGDFMAAYAGNRSAAHELALDASPLAGPIRQLLAEREEWAGTVTELLEALAMMVTEQTRKSDGWPRAANALSNKLRVLTPNLRAVGIEVKLPSHQHSSQQRQVVIRRGWEKTAQIAQTAQKDDKQHKNVDLPVGDPVSNLGDLFRDRPQTAHANRAQSKPVGDVGDPGGEESSVEVDVGGARPDPHDPAHDLESELEDAL